MHYQIYALLDTRISPMFRKRNCFAYMCIQYYELLNSSSCEGTLDAPGSQRLCRLSLLSPVAVCEPVV